jgi:hypothetical protein
MFLLLVLYHGRQVQERTSSSLACSSYSSFTMESVTREDIIFFQRGQVLERTSLPAHVRPTCPLPWTSGVRKDILFILMFVLLVLYHGRQVQDRTSFSCPCSSPLPLPRMSGVRKDILFLCMLVLLVLYHRRQVQERTSSSLACSSCSLSSLSSAMDVRYKERTSSLFKEDRYY